MIHKKYTVSPLILGFLLTLIISCDGVESKAIELKKTQNRTAINDSIYNFFWLYSIDTMDGFDEYFSKKATIDLVEDEYHLFKNGTENQAETILEKIAWRIFVKSYILKTHINQIRLSRKNPEVMHACRYGTIGEISITLREGNDFDIHATSWFTDELYEGSYKIVSDTLFLFFDGEKRDSFSDTLIVTEEQLLPPGGENSNYIMYFRKSESGCY